MNSKRRSAWLNLTITMVTFFQIHSLVGLNKNLLQVPHRECVEGQVFNSGGNCAEVFAASCLNKECTMCEEGFYSFQNACLLQSIEGCVRYLSNKNSCLEFGESQTRARILESVNPHNCRMMVRMLGVTLCMECQQGFYMENWISMFGPHCTEQNLRNCKKMSLTAPTCMECEEGFAIQNGVCTDKEMPAFCQTISQMSGECLLCKNLYFMNDARDCEIMTDENCTQNMDNSQTCVRCKDQYVNNDGACDLSNERNCLPGMFDLGTNECRQCESRFFPVERSCQRVSTEGCVQSNGLEDSCMRCDNLHFFNEDRECEEVNISGCMESDGVDNACTECNTDHISRMNACERKRDTDCKQGRFNEGTNRCGECNSLFFPNDDGLCVQISQSSVCADSDGLTDSCSRCSADAYRDSYRVCKQSNLDNCQQQFDGFPVCQICNENYYLDDDFSCKRQNRPHCLAYRSNQNFCTQCEEESAARGGICYRYERNFCRPGQWDSSRRRCRRCLPMSYPEGHGCRNFGWGQLRNCVLTNGFGYTCTGTDNGYYYYRNRGLHIVKTITDPKCMFNINLEDRCRVCAPGYALNQSQRCVPIE